MNPHFAATRNDINDAAFWYWQMGISVIPCRGKVPNIAAWQAYQTRRATRAELDRWIKEKRFKTIGILCGAVSNNLVVMDLDGLAAVSAFELKFPNLAADTYTVVSGSGMGRHVYFQCQALPATTRVSLGTKYGFELRASGCYVIAPPSLHPDSLKPYLPANDAPVKTYADLEFVRQWVHGLIRQKYQQPGQQPPRPLPAHRPDIWTPREQFMKEAYLRSAMHRQVNMVIHAQVGTRNDALYMSALCLGQLVAGGELARGNIESMLLNAAITTGLDEIEARRTIASGLDDGAEDPRVVPAAPKKA